MAGHQRAAATTHQCDRTHRSYQTLAECCWPAAAWVAGDGPFAVLAHCDMLSVTLCDSIDAARAQRDRTERCCRDCTGDHEIVVLALDVDDRPRQPGLLGRLFGAGPESSER